MPEKNCQLPHVPFSAPIPSPSRPADRAERGAGPGADPSSLAETTRILTGGRAPSCWRACLCGALPGALVGFSADLIGCLISPFGYNPIFCVPPILYGLLAGLLRRYVLEKPTLPRTALAFFPAALFGSVLWQSMALALVYGGDAKQAFS